MDGIYFVLKNFNLTCSFKDVERSKYSVFILMMGKFLRNSQIVYFSTICFGQIVLLKKRIL